MRYIIFAGDEYYPTGGWDDFHAFSDTIPTTKDLPPMPPDFGGLWAHTVDTKDNTIIQVWTGRRPAKARTGEPPHIITANTEPYEWRLLSDAERKLWG